MANIAKKYLPHKRENNDEENEAIINQMLEQNNNSVESEMPDSHIDKMVTIIDILQHAPGKNAGKGAMIHHLNAVLEQAIANKLMSRQSNLISSNAADFAYWLEYYYDYFITFDDDDIFKVYLPIAIILHSIMALKFQLARNINSDKSIPIYDDRIYLETHSKINITTVNRAYYENLYHVVLALRFLLDFKNDTDVDVFMYYYHVYILESSPMEHNLRTNYDGSTYKLDNDGLEYFINYLENEEVILPFNISPEQTEISISEVYDQLNPHRSAKYRNDVLQVRYFYNFVSYKLYLYEVYHIGAGDTFNNKILKRRLEYGFGDYYGYSHNLSILNSYASANYLLLHAKVMRRSPLPRPYQVVTNSKMQLSILANNSAQVNIISRDEMGQYDQVKLVISNILLQEHVAKYGLIYTAQEITSLLDQIGQLKSAKISADDKMLMYAMIIKMGVSDMIVYSLSYELSFATLLTGVLPQWKGQIVNYWNLPTNIKDCNESNYKNYFLQNNYLKYSRLFHMKTIDIVDLQNVLQSVAYMVIPQYNKVLKYNIRYMLDDFYSYLPPLDNVQLMQAPINQFTNNRDILFPHHLDRMALYGINNRSQLNYIYFTYNNQQLCDIYNLANIYPRFYLFQLLAILIIHKGEYLYTRLNHYKLGDGKLYSHAEQKDINIDLTSKKLIIELVMGEYLYINNIYDIVNLIGIIYALNLFQDNNLQQYNKIMAKHGVSKGLSIVL